MEIVAQQGDISQVKADAIVDPEPGSGETPVGEAIYTPVEKLPYKGIVHAPAMGTPAGKTTLEKVRQATIAALLCADSYGVKLLAMPAMGTGIGGVELSAAADAMVETLRHYETASIRKIILIDRNPDMVTAFRNALMAERF